MTDRNSNPHVADCTLPPVVEPSCPSCGIPYVDHIGLVGTCAELLKAKEQARLGWERNAESDAAYQSALDRLEIAKTALKVIADPKADLPTDGRETCRIYEDMALEALTRIKGFNPTGLDRSTIGGTTK